MWRFRTIPTIYMQAIRNPSVGIKKRKGESESDYQARITQDIQTAQNSITEHIGTAPTTFVYPFGAFPIQRNPYIRSMGFQATFVCESRTNILTQNPECLYGLGRYLRTNRNGQRSLFFKHLETVIFCSYQKTAYTVSKEETLCREFF